MVIGITKNTKSAVSSSLSTSVKKRPTIFIPQSDPRNNPQYINSHPGQITVLSDEEYLKYINQNPAFKDGSSTSNGPTPDDNQSPADFPTAVKDIAAPGKPQWNTTDITYGTSDTGVYENITITFNESIDDPMDNSFVYHVNYYPGTLTTVDTTSTTLAPTSGNPITGSGSSGAAKTSSQTSATTKASVKAITTVNHTSSFFAIEWNALPNATNYTVKVTGWNIPGKPLTTWTHSYVVASSGGAAPNSHYGVGSLNFGIYQFTLTAASGAPFIGTYSIVVQANYASGSSTGVSHSVTI